MKATNGGIYARIIKRPMDFVLSMIAIVVLSPVILVLAVLVRTKLGSPVLFKQERPGLNEEIFMMYKFRTMTDEKDDFGVMLPDSVRLTKFGEFLRFTSLDELPGIFNILKGNMSIIGPRPLLVRYLPYYTEYEKLRHNVRPGLSGLAQISGRNTLKWEDRLSADIEYVNNITFLMDIKIILKTIVKAFKREGVTIIDKSPLKDLDVERRKFFENPRIKD